MKRETASVFFSAATVLATLSAVLGIVMLARLIEIDPPLPPLDVAVSAEATITDNFIKPSEMTTGKFPRQLPARYFVHVAFLTPDAQMQANDIEVSQGYFDAHLPGKRVTVWYFPGRPQVNVLSGPEALADTRSRYGQLFGWLLLGAGVWFAATSSNRLMIARRGHGWL